MAPSLADLSTTASTIGGLELEEIEGSDADSDFDALCTSEDPTKLRAFLKARESATSPSALASAPLDRDGQSNMDCDGQSSTGGDNHHALGREDQPHHAGNEEEKAAGAVAGVASSSSSASGHAARRLLLT